MQLFFCFQYGFRSPQLTADLLTVVCDRITGAFDRCGTTRAVALNIFKAFDRVWHWHTGRLQTSVLCNFRPDIWPYFVFS